MSVVEGIVVGREQHRVALAERLRRKRDALQVEMVLAQAREHRHVRVGVFDPRAARGASCPGDSCTALRTSTRAARTLSLPGLNRWAPQTEEGIAAIERPGVREFEERLLAGEITDSFTVAACIHARLRGLPRAS
jgi:hypothetical protein